MFSFPFFFTLSKNIQISVSTLLVMLNKRQHSTTFFFFPLEESKFCFFFNLFFFFQWLNAELFSWVHSLYCYLGLTGIKIELSKEWQFHQLERVWFLSSFCTGMKTNLSCILIEFCLKAKPDTERESSRVIEIQILKHLNKNLEVVA